MVEDVEDALVGKDTVRIIDVLEGQRAAFVVAADVANDVVDRDLGSNRGVRMRREDLPGPEGCPLPART